MLIKMDKTVPEKLVKVTVYSLQYYYYEKGEHWSGYTGDTLTESLEEAEAWTKRKPAFTHDPNKSTPMTAYKDEATGKYYKIEQLRLSRW